MGLDLNRYRGPRRSRQAISQVKVTGLKELEANIQQLIREVGGAVVEEALYEDAIFLRNRIRMKAPKGPPKPKGVNPRAILRRGIVAKKFAKLQPGNPGAFVAVDYGIAPHAHLVEFGHEAAGRNKIGKRVPAHPFWRPAVRAFKQFLKTEGALKRIIANFRPGRMPTPAESLEAYESFAETARFE